MHDELRNLSDYERPYQVIYHANFGAPPFRRRRHFRAAAAKSSRSTTMPRRALPTGRTYLPVTPGFDEMVFNIWPLADANPSTRC